jgi:hypothetical protein
MQTSKIIEFNVYRKIQKELRYSILIVLIAYKFRYQILRVSIKVVFIID